MSILKRIVTANFGRISQLLPGAGNNQQARVSDVNAVIDVVNDHEDRIDAIEGGTISLTEVVVSDGTAAAPSITNDGDQDTGLYFSAANEVAVSNGGTGQVKFTDGTLEPITDNDIDLGTASKEFKNLYIDGTANIDALAADLATVTSASASALAVGVEGATNPAFVVDSSTASQAAGLKVTGAVAAGTVAAAVISSGSDASLSINAKGTGTLTLQGTATGNIVVGDDIVPDVDNTLDIGNLASNNRDIHASRSFVTKGVSNTEGYGVLTLKYAAASKAMAGGATEVITLSIPTGVILVGAQLRNDTLIVGAGAATYSAAYSGGSTAAISSGTAFAKNTKVSTMFDANAATAITSNTTNITLTPDAGTLDTGTVTAIVYYYQLTDMTSAA